MKPHRQPTMQQLQVQSLLRAASASRPQGASQRQLAAQSLFQHLQWQQTPVALRTAWTREQRSRRTSSSPFRCTPARSE